jgi:hypothetical protein
MIKSYKIQKRKIDKPFLDIVIYSETVKRGKVRLPIHVFWKIHKTEGYVLEY